MLKQTKEKRKLMNKIYLIGDIHGKFQPIRDLLNKIHYNKMSEDTPTIIILGDAGLNYYLNERDSKVKAKIESYKINIFCVRGNHEQRPSICLKANRDKWHVEKFWGNLVFVENDFPHIKYALDYPSDYYIPTAQRKFLKTLVLPGAYSVDKYYRISMGWSWFKYEQPTQEEMEIGTELANLQDWDLILSHTCPIIYEPTDLFLSNVDQSIVDKTTEKWLGEIEYNINYKLWCWGHYHANRIYPTVENKEKLMLFNDCVLDLYKFFCGHYDIENSLIKIYNNTQIDNLNLLFE